MDKELRFESWTEKPEDFPGAKHLFASTCYDEECSTEPSCLLVFEEELTCIYSLQVVSRLHGSTLSNSWSSTNLKITFICMTEL